MLSDLVTLGRRLREDGKIPPPGFKIYSPPIRWTITIRFPVSQGEQPEFGLIEDGSHRPRPDSGRTDVTAYPLVDFAAYVFGVEIQEDGKPAKKVAKKHAAFLERLDQLAEAVVDADLSQVIGWLREALAQCRIPVHPEVRADHWISVEVKDDRLAGAPLFEHPEIVKLWQSELRESVTRNGDAGECSVTGVEGSLVYRTPGQGYFQKGSASLVGLNEDAYVSYHGGPNVKGKASVGLSYEAAELATRALEYLSRSSTHQRWLVKVEALKNGRKSFDPLQSLTALTWMDVAEPVVVGHGDEVRELVQDELITLITAPVDPFREDQKAPRADLGDVRDLLNAPLTGKDTGLDLDTADVHLAVLSKNAFRVVVRDYRTETLGDVKRHLSTFLDAASLPAPDARGRVHASRPVSIHEMLRTTYGIVDEKGKMRALAAKSVNHARALFRTAYFGTPPPHVTLQPALARIGTLMTKEDDPNRPFRLHALLSLVKLILTYQTADAMTIEPLSPDRNERAFRCGELLAVLGRIQQDALTDDNKKGEGGATLNRTITERYFASASLAPSAYLGTLVQRATTAHIPKLPENWKTDGPKDFRKTAGWALNRLQSLSARIHDLGGYPDTLDLKGQGEFALGYYHQRAQFFSSGKPTGDDTDAQDSAASTDLLTSTS